MIDFLEIFDELIACSRLIMRDWKAGQNLHTARKRVTVDLTDRILHAFVPKDCDGAVIDKYWGSVHLILTGKDDIALLPITRHLKELWLLIRDIRMGVRTDNGDKQARFHILQALPAAFQQLVVFLVMSSCGTDQAAISSKYEHCKTLLIEGRKQLLLMVHTLDFRGRVGFEAVSPQALLALMISNLISSISPDGDCDLTEVYSEYTLKLQSMVRDRASVGVYDKIKLLQEEVDTVKTGLVQQHNIMEDFKIIVRESQWNTGLSTAVIDRILEAVEQQIEDFNELQAQADNARFLAAQSISMKTEDNNNKAILVFPVTTIIFLPLSFATSFLGMNTSDSRNMDSSQNLFWAIDIPLTLAILTMAWVVAFFGSLKQRALRVLKRSEAKHD